MTVEAIQNVTQRGATRLRMFDTIVESPDIGHDKEMSMMNRLFLLGGVAFAAGAAFAADTAKPTVTFAKDIVPIFQEKCQDCHRPNSMAPMSLFTYQEARPWAKSIKQR